MEESKPIKQFGVFEIPKDKTSESISKIPVKERSRGSTFSVNTDKTTNINIGKGVIIHINTSIMETLNVPTNDTDYPYKKVLTLDKLHPDLIEGFSPPLYKEFIYKNKLLNHVNIGDNVIINPKYKERNGDISRPITDIYFKSLNNMTVLIAVLGDGELVLYNRLQLCK